jgi:hypothetical protein
MTESQEWLHVLQSHQARFPDACIMSDGFSLPFLVGCHSAATFGNSSDRALSLHTFLLAQYGHALRAVDVLLFICDL